MGGLLGSLFLTDVSKTLADGTEIAVVNGSLAQGNDNVVRVGSNSNNMNGLTGTGDATDPNDNKGYDLGIELGKQGTGADDVRSFSFTLSSSEQALTLDDFRTVDFGVRIDSIGQDIDGDGTIDTDRSSTAKIAEALTTGETTTFIGSTNDDQVITVGSGANAVNAGGGDDLITTPFDSGPDVIDGGTDSGGGDTDKVVVEGGDAGETYVIAPYVVDGMTYAGIDGQSTAGTEISTINVEEIVLIAGAGADTIYLQGDLSLAGVAENTVVVHGNGGDDLIDASGLVGVPPVKAKLYGEAGNDTLIGGGNDDLLDGRRWQRHADRRCRQRHPGWRQ